MIKLGSKVIEVTKFPDGTSQVWQIPHLNSELAEKTITWEFEREEELIHVIQLATLLRSQYNVRPRLYIPYLPYARQDKNISNETTWSLRVFMNLLLDYFSDIQSLDIHNPNAEAIKYFIKNIEPIEELTLTLINSQPDFLVFPDDGARVRYLKLPMLKALPYVYCEKVRDQKTGAITDLKLLDRAVEIEGKRALIVDDLCDRGGTFIRVAEKLKEHKVKNIDLYTTHGLYTGGLDIIREAGITGFYNRHIYKRKVI